MNVNSHIRIKNDRFQIFYTPFSLKFTPDPVRKLNEILEIVSRQLKYDPKVEIEGGYAKLLGSAVEQIYNERSKQDLRRQKKIVKIVNQIYLKKVLPLDLRERNAEIEVIKPIKEVEDKEKAYLKPSLLSAIHQYSKNKNFLVEKIIYAREGIINLEKTLESFKTLTVLELLDIFSTRSIYTEYEAITTLDFMKTCINRKICENLEPLRTELFSLLKSMKINSEETQKKLQQVYYYALEYNQKNIYKFSLENRLNFLKDHPDKAELDKMINIKDDQNKTALMYIIEAEDLETYKLFRELQADIEVRTLQGETALTYAVKIGNKKIVQCLLKDGAKIDLKSLICAAVRGEIGILEVFLKEGADINAKDNDKTMLMCAVAEENLISIHFLIDNKADIYLQDKNGRNALTLAITSQQVQLVMPFLKVLEKDIGIDIVQQRNLQSFKTLTLLELLTIFSNKKVYEDYQLIKEQLFSILKQKGIEKRKEIEKRKNIQQIFGKVFFNAVEYQEQEVYEYCLENGVNVDIQDEYGLTALMYAARSGNIKVLEQLIKAGAKVNAQDGYGITPLMYAARLGNVEILKLLIAAGADIHAKDEKHRTALIYAIINKQKASIKALLEKGANIYDQDEDEVTVLMYAAEAGEVDTIRQLIEAGVKVNEQDGYGITPLMYAAGAENVESLKLLIAAGAILNTRDEDGMTALIHAAKGAKAGWIENYNFLIDKGADTTIQDKDGMTALKYADLWIKTFSPTIL